VQDLRIAYRSLAWMSAIGGYLMLHYRQWQMAAGFLAGAATAALLLWSLQQMVNMLGVSPKNPRRWWWKSAWWRYPLVLILLWAVSKQSTLFIVGFTGGVTLLPLSVVALAASWKWQIPAWFRVQYWAPKTLRRTREG
jgi:hypothetical protein